jgi:hypothetical protein
MSCWDAAQAGLLIRLCRRGPVPEDDTDGVSLSALVDAGFAIIQNGSGVATREGRMRAAELMPALGDKSDVLKFPVKHRSRGG